MTDLPTALYDAAGTRSLDETAIAVHGMDGFDLMSRAGEAAFRDLCELWPDASRITIICGPGNNGGDGYVVGALASRQGLKVELAALAPPRSDA
jgi:ADP-dependent NAD(P)H-hydrate dehydratase / NAD(P)H-hydrate epimerase